MNFDLTPEQKAIQAAARDFARREIDPIVEEHDEKQLYPRAVMAKVSRGPMSYSTAPSSP